MRLERELALADLVRRLDDLHLLAELLLEPLPAPQLVADLAPLLLELALGDPRRLPVDDQELALCAIGGARRVDRLRRCR